jgi:hypothetical protein
MKPKTGVDLARKDLGKLPVGTWGTTTRGGGPVPGLGRQYFDSDLPALPRGRNRTAPRRRLVPGGVPYPVHSPHPATDPRASWGPGSSFMRPSGEGLSHPRPDVLEKHLWLHRKYDAAIGRAVRAYEEGKSFRQEEELKRLEKYLSLPRFKEEAARARRNVARAEKERKTASR